MSLQKALIEGLCRLFAGHTAGDVEEIRQIMIGCAEFQCFHFKIRSNISCGILSLAALLIPMSQGSCMANAYVTFLCPARVLIWLGIASSVGFMPGVKPQV